MEAESPGTGVRPKEIQTRNSTFDRRESIRPSQRRGFHVPIFSDLTNRDVHPIVPGLGAAGIGTGIMTAAAMTFSGGGGHIDQAEAHKAALDAYQSAVTESVPVDVLNNGVKIVPIEKKAEVLEAIDQSPEDIYINEAISKVFKNLTPDEQIGAREKVKEMVELLKTHFTGEDYIRVLQYEELIKQVSMEHGYSSDVAEGLALIESRGHTEGPEAESEAGALGLWQLMPDTAREMGLIVDFDQGIDERIDPVKSTKAAIGYLKRMEKETFGNSGLEILAYNWGWGQTMNAADALGGIKDSNIHRVVVGTPWMPKEANEYGYKAVAGMVLLNEYKDINLSDENETNSSIKEPFDIADQASVDLKKMSKLRPGVSDEFVKETIDVVNSKFEERKAT